MEKKSRSKWFYVGMAMVAGLFLLTRFFQFGTNPVGIHVDEAGMAYDAWNLAQYGTDRYGNPYPVYLINFDAGQSALYAYMAAFFMKFLGLTMTAIRLPAVVSSLLLVTAGYLIAREVKDEKLGLITAALLTICPYFIMASRWGLDCNLFLGFFTFSLCLLILAVKRQRWGYFALAGVFFGITLYTYVMSFMVLPLFLGLSLLYLFWCRKVRLSQVLALGVCVGCFAVPLILMLAVNNGYLEEIKTAYFTIPRLFYYRGGEFSLKNIPTNLKLFQTLLYHDHLDYNASFTYGTLYVVSIFLLIPGVIVSGMEVVKQWRQRQVQMEVFVWIMCISVLFCSLIVFDGYIINKSNALFFPLAFFAARGLYFVWQKRKIAGYMFSVLYVVFFIGFCSQYFGSEKDYQYLYFEKDLPEAVQYIEAELQLKGETKVYVDGYGIQQPYIFACLVLKLSPEEFASGRESETVHYGRYYFELPEEIDGEGMYLLPAGSEVAEGLQELGFMKMQFGKLNLLMQAQ